MLEAPFVPQFTSGPSYWRDSGIVLLASTLLSLFVYFVYALVHGRQPLPLVISPLSVTASRSSYSLTRDHAEPRLAFSPENFPICLSAEQTQSLHDHANSDGRLVIALLACGLTIDELEFGENCAIDAADAQQPVLVMRGRFARRLPLHRPVADRWLDQVSGDNYEISGWRQANGEPLSIEEMRLLTLGAATDAGFKLPAQATLENLRLSYLAYLARQGCPLNRLDQLGGFVSARELAALRQLAPTGQALSTDAISTIYPLKFGV